MVTTLINAARLARVEISGTGIAYDRLRTARQSFLDKIQNNMATATDLLNFILLIDDVGGDVMPGSTGMEWMEDHPDEFLAIVGDADAFIETVLDLVDKSEAANEDYDASARPLAYWFFRRFLASRPLMELLTPAWRELYVSELYPRFGAMTDDWIAVAVQVGVRRKIIADAILKRLASIESKPEGHADLDGFLQYGIEQEGRGKPIPMTLRRMGVTGIYDASYDWYAQNPVQAFVTIERIVRERAAALANDLPDPVTYRFVFEFESHERPTENERWDAVFRGMNSWSVLTREELILALRVCAEEAPSGVVSRRAQMQRRLDPATVESIIASAVGRLTSVYGIPATELDRLDLDRRKSLAERLDVVKSGYAEKTVAQFLFRVLMDLPMEARRSFYEQTVCRILETASADTVYRAWRQLGQIDRTLEHMLQRQLDDTGWMVGAVETGPRPGGGIQFLVRVDGMRYVQNRDQHRYHPAAADTVLFRRDGRRLTPTVIAVNFYPVLTDPTD